MPSIANVYDSTVAFQRERHANPDKYRGWSWFIPTLNGYCGRIQPGWDVRITGEPKTGKTTAMICQALAAMREGAYVFYIGNEENEEQLIGIHYHVSLTDNRFNLLYPFYLNRGTA